MRLTRPISTPTRTKRTAAVLALTSLIAAGCSGSSDDLRAEVVAGYADGVYASYAASLASATAMDGAIDAFVAAPDQAGLDAARTAWLDARDDYGPTEAFRFYGGPIDDESTGVEGLLNAWPLDEAYIDYVQGAESSGLISDLAGTPEITADVLLAANELGGESNVATGWHAIEFLLWGQDLSVDGPGDRQATDYSDAAHADRRGTYLAVVTDLLLEHLGQLVDAWAPTDGAYRAEFLALETEEALTNILTSAGELSRGELAGERMSVAYFERSQEDEHSCFSDNTTADIIGNAIGIQRLFTGSYPGIEVTGLLQLVAEVDAELASTLESEIAASVAATQAIPAPFDQHLQDNVSDDDPGRQSVLTAIEALEDQTTTIVAAAAALAIPVAVQ
jgi:putative iron-regulated protein